MARNFLVLSKTYLSSCVSKWHTERNKKLSSVIDLLGNDYGRGNVAQIAETLLEKEVPIPDSTLHRYLRIIGKTVEFFRADTENQREIRADIDDLNDPQLRRAIILIIESFEKDGLGSWEKIEEAFGKDAEDSESCPASFPEIIPKPDKDDSEPENKTTRHQLTASQFVDETLALIKNNIYDPRIKDIAEKFMGYHYGTAVRKNELLEERLLNLSRELASANGRIEKLAAENERQLSEICARDQTIERLAKNRKAILGEAVAAIIRIEDPLAAANVAAGGNQEESGQDDDPEPPAHQNGSFSFDSLPTRSAHFDVPIMYGEVFRENFNNFNKRARKALTNAIIIISENGSEYPSLKAEKVKRTKGVKPHIPMDATTGWAGTKHRLIWSLTSNGLEFFDCYRKNKSPIMG